MAVNRDGGFLGEGFWKIHNVEIAGNYDFLSEYLLIKYLNYTEKMYSNFYYLLWEKLNNFD